MIEMHKILIIDLHCDALLPSGLGEFGGGNSYSKAVISAIVKSNIDCLYITRKKTGTLADEEFIAPNLKYIRISTGQVDVEDKDTLYLYSDEVSNTILNIVTKLNFIPTLIHSIYWPSGIVAIKLCEYFKIPFIHTILSNGKRKLLQSGAYEIADIRTKYEEECFKNAQYIICSSLYEQKDVSQLYNISMDKLIVTGLEVENAFLNPSYDRTGNYKLNTITESNLSYINIDQSSHTAPSLWWNKGAFLFYGRLHPDKGVLEIIDSWLELKKEYSQLPSLWIAGGSPEQIHKMRKLVADKESLARYEEIQEIIWWGRLTAEGLSTLMLKSLVLITHSRYESGGLMVLEAMAQGIPVIATPFGYAGDYIQDWENGFIVPFLDRIMLKRRMLHFMYQPFLSAIMGKHANFQYKRISRKFDFANKHIKLYQQKEFERISAFEDTIALDMVLPYPLAEYIPTDEDVLSFFLQYMKNDSCEHVSTPFLAHSIDYEQYHIWLIEYNEKKYQCFRWKNHLNRERILGDKCKYFYSCKDLVKLDKQLYDVGICYSPINMPLKYHISIHDLSLSNHTSSIKTNFEKLFYGLEEVQLPLDTIKFENVILETKAILCNYGYQIEHISSKVYRFLENIELDYEVSGLVPEFLYPHSLIHHQFVHIGRLCISSQSYFYAKYLLFYNQTQISDIQNFFEANDISNNLHRNIFCWIINLLFRENAKHLIYHNQLNKNTLYQMLEILKSLE